MPGPTGPITDTGGAGGAWGAITGALADQLDLLAALDLKSDVGHSHNGLAPTAGTTGQVLKKVSNTNYDYAWAPDEEGAGGAPDWGDIGGTLANQTDLQAALDAKQPLDADLTTIAGLAATSDNFMVAAASAWASRTPAQAKTSLALVKGDVGLGNVDNTSDANKPVSTAQQTALDLKQSLSGKDAASGYAGLSAGSKLTGSQQTYGAIANTACEGNDSRLSDARAPTAHKTSHENAGSDELSVAGLSGVLADPQPPIIGAGGTQAVAGNDARLTDARTPTAHKTSHQAGGSDALDGLAPTGGTTGQVLKKTTNANFDYGWAVDATGGAGGGAQGTATLNFGAFPGASDASVDVTGQSGYTGASLAEAWLNPIDTADHTADEHIVETIKVCAKYSADGIISIIGLNTNQINEPLEPVKGVTSVIAGGLSAPHGFQQQTRGGRGTRLYGQWSVAWRWA